MSRFVQFAGCLALLLLCLDAAKARKYPKVTRDNTDSGWKNGEKATSVTVVKAVEKPIDFNQFAGNITENVGKKMKVMMEEWKSKMGDWKESMVDIKDTIHEGKEEMGKNSRAELKELMELIILSESIQPQPGMTQSWMCGILYELRGPEALPKFGEKKKMEVMRKAINLINGIDENMSDEAVIEDGGENEDEEKIEDGENNEDGEESEEVEMNMPELGLGVENGDDSETAGNIVRRNAVPPPPQKSSDRLRSEYSEIIHEGFFYRFVMKFCGFRAP